MKMLIVNYNRLTLTKNMVDWAISNSLEPIILDNCSNYPPLLKYYDENPCKVVRLKRNHGHKVLWNNPILFKVLGITGQYIVSDPDLDLVSIPPDFLQVLQKGLKKYPKAVKCGFSLEVNDLPETRLGKEVKQWESQFWEKPLDDVYFDAGIDTTFALYRGTYFSINNSIRTNRPYTAKHIPWYYENTSSLSEDEQYYFKTASSSFSWKNKFTSDYIVSCYFTSSVDAQRGTLQETNSHDYISVWYESVKKHNVNIVILHDGLSDDFIAQYPDVRFVKVPPVPEGMMLYDYRWHVGYEFLQTVDADNIFFTDISDVEMLENPFISKDYQKGVFYCGDEPCAIRENLWLQKSLKHDEMMSLPEFLTLYEGYKRVVNPGLFGGEKGVVLEFLKVFTGWLTKLVDRQRDGIGDMMVFNYCFHTQTTEINKKYGPPVNTIFKKYEKNKNVWFRHK
jgi:hypothetical protein